LCPEINDGAILEKTLRDLAAHCPKIVSTAVVPVALTRYNTDERLTRVTPEFCQETIKQVEKLQSEFRRTLGTTFAFLGDEIYLKAGAQIPSRRHYGNYPQIEDGVGMVRSFVAKFERLLNRRGAVTQRSGKVRTHESAIKPRSAGHSTLPTASWQLPIDFGTILTGEMFAPILREQIDKYNTSRGSRLHVLAVPNTYFGGDVAVAGLLTGQDFLNVRDEIVGEFAIIPRVTIKSDEPIFLDGMTYDALKEQFPVPVFDLDLDGLINFLAK
jgi:NifB/MoaA-like Fe-S oxidoreductase